MFPSLAISLANALALFEVIYASGFEDNNGVNLIPLKLFSKLNSLYCSRHFSLSRSTQPITDLINSCLSMF